MKPEAVMTESRSATLGQVLRKARADLSMSQRDVEDATNRQISNAYLSQLESGKIVKPSPHVLHSLATVLQISYESLMERAGYIAPASEQPKSRSRMHSASFSVDNLTADEESALLDYLSFLRSKKS